LAAVIGKTGRKNFFLIKSGTDVSVTLAKGFRFFSYLNLNISAGFFGLSLLSLSGFEAAGIFSMCLKA